MAKRIRLVSTAYGAPWGGIQGTGVTSTGIDLRAHPKQYVVAVDPSVIPLGTHLKIADNPFGDPNIVFTAADTGGAIKGRRLDFYDWRGRKAQLGWGTRPIEAEIVGHGGGRQAASPGASRAPGGAAGQPAVSSLTSSSGFSDAQSGADLASVLKALSAQKAPAPVSALPDPAFSARKSLALPAGYQPISSGPPQPKSDLTDQILQLLPALGGDATPTSKTQTVVIPGSQSSPSAAGGTAPAVGGRGRLLGRPIDRPGVPTGKGILRFAAAVADVYGKPVRLGTGTAHNQYVQGTTRQSAHWTGRALDLPTTPGAENLALGRAALVAAGMPRSQARKASGGVYNIGGYQILFNTQIGGNHTNHVHIGLRG